MGRGGGVGGGGGRGLLDDFDLRFCSHPETVNVTLSNAEFSFRNKDGFGLTSVSGNISHPDTVTVTLSIAKFSSITMMAFG